MIFADTGYFLALLNPRDALHERALAWETATEETVLTSEGVLAELLDAMAAPRHRRLGIAIVWSLLDDPDTTWRPWIP